MQTTLETLASSSAGNVAVPREQIDGEVHKRRRGLRRRSDRGLRPARFH
jgi:hypothetical protein